MSLKEKNSMTLVTWHTQTHTKKLFGRLKLVTQHCSLLSELTGRTAGVWFTSWRPRIHYTPPPWNAVLAVPYPPPSPTSGIGLHLWFGRHYATYLLTPIEGPVAALSMERCRIISICCVLEKRLCWITEIMRCGQQPSGHIGQGEFLPCGEVESTGWKYPAVGAGSTTPRLE